MDIRIKRLFLICSLLLVSVITMGCNLIEVSTDEVKNNQSDEEMRSAYLEIMPNFWECNMLTPDEVKSFEERYKGKYQECVKKDVIGHKELDRDKAWKIRGELYNEAHEIHFQRILDSYDNNKNKKNEKNDYYYDAKIFERGFRGSIY